MKSENTSPTVIHSHHVWYVIICDTRRVSLSLFVDGGKKRVTSIAGQRYRLSPRRVVIISSPRLNFSKSRPQCISEWSLSRYSIASLLALSRCHRYKCPAHTSRKCLLRLCKCPKLEAFSRNCRDEHPARPELRYSSKRGGVARWLPFLVSFYRLQLPSSYNVLDVRYREISMIYKFSLLWVWLSCTETRGLK